MDMLHEQVQNIKKEFEVALEVSRSNKMVENKLNELLKDVQENNTVVTRNISKIQSFFDELSTNLNLKMSTLQKALEDRDEYKFKAESLERTLLELQKEIDFLKKTEKKPTYTDKEVDFLHQENNKLICKERELQRQVNNYKAMEVELLNYKNENELLKKSNVEIQAKLIEKDVECHRQSCNILKQNDEIIKLGEELKSIKAKILFMENSHITQFKMQHLVAERVDANDGDVEQQQRRPHRDQKEVEYSELEETKPKGNTSKQTDLVAERVDANDGDVEQQQRRPHCDQKDVEYSELEETKPKGNTSKQTDLVAERVDANDETVEQQQRRPHRNRKEVNYTEIEETMPKENKSKRTVSGVGGSNILTQRVNKTQKKRIKNKNVQLSVSKVEEQDGKAASVEDDVNLQNMDPNVEEELAMRRLASGGQLFKSTFSKKRNKKQ